MELSGIWGLKDLPFLDLTLDSSQSVSGTTHWRAQGRSAQAAIKKGSFDPTTRTLRLEGDTPSMDGKGESHYVIEGSLDDETLSVTYDCGGLKGHRIFTKIPARKA
jgi:hypothetical protein